MAISSCLRRAVGLAREWSLLKDIRVIVLSFGDVCIDMEKAFQALIAGSSHPFRRLGGAKNLVDTSGKIAGITWLKRQACMPIINNLRDGPSRCAD